jgi:GGDEF domain-containing protein
MILRVYFLVDKLIKDLEKMAATDNLTGLLNRNRFLEQAEEEY